MCYSLWVKRLSMSTGSATTLPVSWRSSSQALYQALLTNAAFNRIDTLRETDDKFPYGFLPHLQCSYIYITCNITYNIIKYYVQYDIAYIQRVAHCARVCPYAVCWSQCFWSNTWIQWWWYPVWTLSRTATSLGPWKLPWLQVAQPFWLLSIGSSLSSRTWHCSCHHTSLRLESAREMLQPTWCCSTAPDRYPYPTQDSGTCTHPCIIHHNLACFNYSRRPTQVWLCCMCAACKCADLYEWWHKHL